MLQLGFVLESDLLRPSLYRVPSYQESSKQSERKFQAFWPSFCFASLTGRQLRLIHRSATSICSAQYDISLGREKCRWLSSHEAFPVDAAPQM